MGNPKLELMLVNKQILLQTFDIKPTNVILLVSSVKSLRAALASASGWLRELITETTVSRYTKLPVDVCAFNSAKLYQTAQMWAE